MIKFIAKVNIKSVNMRNIFLLISILLVIFFYFYKINLYPVHDYDEAQLLDIPYRFCTFGDANWPAGFKTAFANDHIRKIPPILYGWLRNVSHKLIGFSPLKSRIISAFMILAIICLTVGILPFFIFRSVWLSLIPLFVLGLHPNIYMAARSVRFEQETVFLGILGTFGLPWINSFVRLRKTRIILIFISGIFIGWSANNHQWGILFLITVLFSFIFFASSWEFHDGIDFKTRILVWGCGVAIPCLITLFTILIDYNNYVVAFSLMSKIYDIDTRVDSFARGLPQLLNLLSPWIVAHINFPSHYIIHEQAIHPIRHYYLIIFWIEVLIILVASFISLINRKKIFNIFVLLGMWLAVGFLLIYFIYPPSYNYFLYPALTIQLGFSFVALTIWENDLPKFKFIKYFVIVLLISIAIVNSIYFISQNSFLMSGNKVNKLISLDTRFQVIADMTRKTGVDWEKKPILCDFMTWIVGGRDHGSVFETGVLCLNSVEKDLGGVIFEMPSNAQFLYSYANLSDLSLDYKINNFKKIINKLSLVGIIFEKNSNSIYYFYIKSMQAPSCLYIAYTKGENDISWGTIEQEKVDILPEKTSINFMIWQNLTEGLYLLRNFDWVDDCTVEVISSKSNEVLKKYCIPNNIKYILPEHLILIDISEEKANIKLSSEVIVGRSVLYHVNKLRRD